jgi:DNA-binding transcriptional LysR family regulator
VLQLYCPPDRLKSASFDGLFGIIFRYNAIMIEPGSLQGLLPFTHAVETGSFTRAAERLGVTASAVGKAIALMEARLGTRLLNRTTRSLGLTPEGEAYYAACVEALTVLDAAQAQLAAHLAAPAGRLRIDLPLTFGRRCVAPILFEIAERFPDLRLDVSFTDRRVDLVPEGIDLAVRMGELDDRVGLVARRIYVERSAVCAAPAYLDRHGRPQTIDDLERHALIVYGRDGFVSPWFIPDAAGRPRKYAPRGRIILGHGEPMLDAALAGCGVTYLPTWLIANELVSGQLERLLSHDLAETASIHAIWPATRTLAPKIRIVVDELVRRFSPPSWETT